MLFEDFNPASPTGDPNNFIDLALSPAARLGFTYETPASRQALTLYDGEQTPTEFGAVSDDWSDRFGGKEESWSQPQFGSEGSSTPSSPGDDLPPVDSYGREMTDAEIEIIIRAYNAANGSSGEGSTGGSSTGSSQSLGPDLSIYDCQHLANLEAQIRGNMEAAINAATTMLAFSAPFQGEEIFNEIWSVFENLNALGLYDPNDPLGTMSRVAGRTVEAGDLIDLSLFGIASNVTISTYQLFFVQSAFAYQLNLDRIDAEQARRGNCGG